MIAVRFILGFIFLATFGSGLGAQELVLPKPGYAATLAKFKTVTIEADSLDVKVAIIPDLYLYDLAVGLEELSKSGYSGAKLQSAIKKLHKKAKKNKGQSGLRVRLENMRSDCQFFLQKKIEKHIKTSKGARVSGVRDLKPTPRFLAWTLFAGASTRKRKLADFSTFEFTIEVKRKKPREAFSVEIADLIRFKEPVKKSEYDRRGINKGARQVMVAHFENLNYPKIEAKFYPAKWKLPPVPKDFQALIDALTKK